MGRDYTTLHAAALCVQLPEGARTWRAYDPEALWTTDRALAAGCLNALNLLVWSKSKDAQRNRNRPKPVGPDARAGRVHRGMAMTKEELDAVLRLPRGGEDA